MDQHAFDRLTRTLATRLGRRAGLRAIAGLAAVGAGASITGHAAAGGGPPLDPFCRAGRQTCTRNQQCCSGTCNVGRGVPIQHRNRCACAGGLTVCGGRCVDISASDSHCGACGVRCHLGDTCIDGDCVDPAPTCTGVDAMICAVSTEGERYTYDFFCGEFLLTTPCTRSSDCLEPALEVIEGSGQDITIDDVDVLCVQLIAAGGNPVDLQDTCLIHTKASLDFCAG